MRHVCLWHLFKYAWEELSDSVLPRKGNTPQNVPLVLDPPFQLASHSPTMDVACVSVCGSRLTGLIAAPSLAMRARILSIITCSILNPSFSQLNTTLDWAHSPF